MGLGRLGGGGGVVQFLCSRGADVTVTDLRSATELALQMPLDQNVQWHLGGHQESDFLNADLLVVNPAVPPGNRFVELARNHGVPITSEIRLFGERCRGRMVAVTGTNGKSTTAALLHEMLLNDGLRVRLGGNMGGSLLPVVDEIAAEEWVVLELSSFQLASLNELRLSPEVAVVTNFSANHLDWHPSLDDYRLAKQTILRWQQTGDVAVLSGADEVRDWPVKGTKLIVETALDFSDVSPALRGPHQARNIATASAAARVIGASQSVIELAVREFNGLPHRMQFVADVRGRRVYDDSASTTSESTLAALQSIDEPIVLLVGGADKRVDLRSLAEGIKRRAKAAVLMGDVSPRLQRMLTEPDPEGGDARLPLAVPKTFPEAVSQAFALSTEGDVILLSPGCSSHGWFANFVERGEEFVRLVGEETVTG